MLFQKEFNEGAEAFRAGKAYNDNPYTRETTKLGNPKPSEETRDQWDAWIQGFGSVGRDTKDEPTYDYAAFKRKSNRYYGARR